MKDRQQRGPDWHGQETSKEEVRCCPCIPQRPLILLLGPFGVAHSCRQTTLIELREQEFFQFWLVWIGLQQFFEANVHEVVYHDVRDAFRYLQRLWLENESQVFRHLGELLGCKLQIVRISWHSSRNCHQHLTSHLACKGV